MLAHSEYLQLDNVTATWIAYRGELHSPMGGATTFLCASVPRIEGISPLPGTNYLFTDQGTL